MSTITLEDIKAQHERMGTMIAAAMAATCATTARSTIVPEEAAIEIAPGEHYAGAILRDDGSVAHHVVLLAPHPQEGLAWEAAMAWAAEQGGSLPTRREQSLLFANAKPCFDKAWYWSSEKHESNGAYAWHQLFNYGNQYDNDTSYEARVRAVRRVTA